MKKYQKAYIAKNNLFSVILRRKEGVKTSLYLDIRDKQSGKRYYEFINKYLTDSPTDIDTEAFAKKQADRRLSELTAIGYYVSENLQPSEGIRTVQAHNFTAFFEGIILNVERKYKMQSKNMPFYALKCLQKWAGGKDIPYHRVTEAFLNAFKRALPATRYNHYNYVLYVAKRARRTGLILDDISEVEPMKKLKPIPVILTEDEVIKLQKTPFRNETIRQFCSLQYACGQRFSDVSVMTWEKINEEGDGYKISITQKKTDKTLPSFVSKELIDWIGEGKERKGLLFPNLPKGIGSINRLLKEWAAKAGITKRITTHTFRRSCATLLYRKGINIVTISKVLGHSNIETTMRYIGVTAEDIFEGLKPIKSITRAFDYGKNLQVA